MNCDPFDIHSLAGAFESLTSLTGLHYSLYDDRRRPVLSSKGEDALLAALRSEEKGQRLYHTFIDLNLRLSAERKDHFIARGPLRQYHVFLPLLHKQRRFVAVAEAFSTSAEDFMTNYRELNPTGCLGKKSREEWSREILTIPLEKMEEKIKDIRAILEDAIASSHERKEHERKSRGLFQISDKMSRLYPLCTNNRDLCENIVSEAVNLIGVEQCSLMLPDETRGHLRISAVKGLSGLLAEGIKVRVGERIVGRAFERGEPVLIEGREEFRDYAVTPNPRFKTSSCLSLPLKIGDEVLGVLNFSDKASEEPFSEEDITFLTPFAQQASMLLKIHDFYVMSERMKELSITDPLTGLHNRRYFSIRLDEEYKRAKRYGLFFALAIVDVDDFKLFNDSEGHLAGDYVLKKIASIMASSVRTNDILVRLGGEEFAVIMPQTPREESLRVMERIRENIRNLVPVRKEWKKYPRENITVSIGVAFYPECEECPEGLIKEADRALYRAKALGKDRIVLWEARSSSEQRVSSGSFGEGTFDKDRSFVKTFAVGG